MDTELPRRRRPWELHAIACLLALAIGYGISEPSISFEWENHVFVLLGVPVCLVGLFRGSPIAWWATTVAFLLLSIGGLLGSGKLVSDYGFRAHPMLLRAHALTVLCLAVSSLLLSCRIRGSFPAPARPWMEDLPAFAHTAAVAAPILFILAAFFSLSIVLLFATRRGSNEHQFAFSLKTITSAEADFRANDRDGNHVNDFWVGDVGGLYGILPRETPNAGSIKLIELSVASADGDPLQGRYPAIPAVPAPRWGGWYQALTMDRSAVPPAPYRVEEDPFNSSRFGFIAYPNDYIAGLKYAFIVNENNTIFRRRLNDDIKASDRIPPGRLKKGEYSDWPDDLELKEQWDKLD